MVLAIVILLSLAPPHYETEITKSLAEKYAAKVEVRLWDGVRVDLLSQDTAWEVDWAKKWAEGCGQALYYGLVTERTPGLILLVRSKDDYRFVYRAQTVCKKYGIRLRVEEVK